ncbi:hypothetical protein [Pedosphaera parvula]|uniref:Uncharacterized protein n=1 Tax=Pedosphaera parvula (strain Ellin514) TaxID=320771 RepID=B9XQ32_PEDPL|nr:hypothetical protein [Pedosphaera parvula]EEF58036.1 hypothetical protein Cflav_PD1173 [Pedosphaera parvula Ellin514]
MVVGADGKTRRACRSEDSASLVRMLALPSEDLPKNLREMELPYPEICEILLERRQTEFLINAYQQSSDARVRSYLVSRVLYYIEEPAVLAVFRAQLSEEEDEESYYVANYVAKTGDTKALKILNCHYYLYPVSSVQWSDTVELFGKFGYRPAIPNLIESLDAASFNLVDAAEESLEKLYPDSPRKFESLEAARDYFTKRAEEERKREEVKR